jgi:hypothetical protein
MILAADLSSSHILTRFAVERSSDDLLVIETSEHAL